METQTLSQFICSYFRSPLSLRQVRDKVFEEFNQTLSANSIKAIWIKTYSKKKYKERILSLTGFDSEKEKKIRKYKKENFEIVRLRDKICQECGEKSKKMDVHHIVLRRLFERYDFEQHDLDNLILLCDKCHSTLGQQLDNIMVDVFENLLRLLNPNTSEYILYKLQILKKYKPKLSPGAPKKYNLRKIDLLQFKNTKGQIDVKSVKQKYFEIPLSHIIKICRENKLIFKCDYQNDHKFMQTKICPVCSWSGAIHIVNHIFNTNDVIHLQLLNKIKNLYLDNNSCEDITNMYSVNNFTKVIIEEIVNRLGIMKSINLINRQCPCCEWQGLYFLKHLVESVDCDHENFKKKVNNMYFEQKKSTTLISKELSCDKKFVYAYVKYLKE